MRNQLRKTPILTCVQAEEAVLAIYDIAVSLQMPRNWWDASVEVNLLNLIPAHMAEVRAYAVGAADAYLHCIHSVHCEYVYVAACMSVAPGAPLIVEGRNSAGTVFSNSAGSVFESSAGISAEVRSGMKGGYAWKTGKHGMVVKFGKFLTDSERVSVAVSFPGQKDESNVGSKGEAA